MFSKIGIVRMIPLILEQLDEKYMTYSECIFGSLGRPQNRWTYKKHIFVAILFALKKTLH